MRRVSLEIIHGVIVSRVLETLQLIESAIEASSLKNNLGAGVVITGGMAHMKGLRELAYNVFKSLPVSIASPKDINGSFDSLKDPAYATVVGLILYGAGQYTNYEQDSNRQIKLRYTQNKSSQNLNLSDLNVRENDLTDLAMKNEGDEAKNDVVIKVDKGKNKKVDKFMKWLKELF